MPGASAPDPTLAAVEREGAAERKRAKFKKKELQQPDKRQSTFLSLKFILTIII